MKNFAGIDFGTTNTTAVIVSGDGAPKPVALENSHLEIPSAIFVDEKSHNLSFGRVAIGKYLDVEDGRLMRSLKRALGTSLMLTGTTIGHRTESFQNIIGEFIANVKSKLDNAAGENIESVVMGRPVHFQGGDAASDISAEKELGEIARNAGFKNILFQYEPIAAAFAHEQNLSNEVIAAVIDIGGGTSDFSIIRLGGKLKNKLDRYDDILANSGVRIGGNDFDKQLSLSHFMPYFGMGSEYNAGAKMLPVPNSFYFDFSEWSRINALYDYKNINSVRTLLLSASKPEKLGRLTEVMERQLGHKVIASVEDTKIKLSENDTALAEMGFFKNPFEIMVSQSEFEQAITAEVARTITALKKCIKQSGVHTDDIGLVILTGGSTEIPFVRESFQAIFPNAQISANDKLGSVGLGLGFDALRRFV